MDKIMYFIATLFVIITVWVMQEENQAWDQQRQLLKAANNKAVHSSIQATNYFNEGIVKIPPSEALQAYQKALQANLGLNTQFKPNSGSPVRSDVRVIYFEIIDDTTGQVFPFLYENTEYHLTKYLRGPAIVAVVEVNYPAIMLRSVDRDPIQVPSIYEYAKPTTS